MGGKRRLWLFAAVTGIVIMAAWSISFVRVNRTYPQAEVIRTGLDEPLKYGPYTITVKKARMEETTALYEENGLSTADRALPEAVLLCTVTIKRNASGLSGQEQADLKIPHIAAASGAWSGMVDAGELYHALNKETVALNELRLGEKQTYLLPFELWRDSFSDISWEHLSERSFMLQLSLYPNKCEILL